MAVDYNGKIKKLESTKYIQLKNFHVRNNNKKLFTTMKVFEKGRVT